MYEAFYKLANDPFRLLPDPEICFPHSSCAKAWAYLRYALKRGEGIVVVTGPPGSGKTTATGKLALWFKSQGRQPLLVGADLYEPARRQRFAGRDLGHGARALRSTAPRRRDGGRARRASGSG